MRCAQCRTQNPDQAKFCLNCGARLAAACPYCHAPLPPQARFCTECGSQVAASPPSGAAAHDLLAQPLQRLVPQAYADRLLATRGQAVSERRLVTILFSDIKGSTAMAEALDPEDVMEIMNGAFEVLIEPVARHEGTLARLMGDAVLAFFGAPLSHEDDAERAVRSALEIVEGARRYAVQLEAERGIRDFGVRVGINTGLVVVGEVGTDLRVEYTAMGDAINLAARLEQHAPPGGILISHDTYRHVRGAFDVVAQEPLAVKGKAEPVQTYRVQRAKAREFRKPTRGVEGIETPMVGREAELARLQDALHAVVEEGACQVVTVVGEAGVGKSRLLYEFDAWCQAQLARVTTFRGRVGQEMQSLPYALLRDLFSRRFEIRESDPADLARRKLVHGITQAFQPAAPDAKSRTSNPASRLPPPDAEMKAHIVGQVLGLDFAASPYVQAIGDDAQQIRDRALVYLADYFRALAARRPVLVLLEDLHWADGSSLHAVDRLAASLAVGVETSPLLIVCAARPSLYQRRPGWGEGRDFHNRVHLDPLSRQDSRRLVGEILQRTEQVPETLRDLLVGGAEGNPFFLEELIKMLIEEGVIRKGETAWSVDAERLGDLQVPPTLTGVLQARLDRLPFDQRQVLQQASVVGRLFWDLAVAHIAAAARTDRAEAQTEAESEAIGSALAALGGREMVFPQPTSAFEGASEYLFKHALLREVTYEGVLKRVRRVYHALVAGWLMEHAADRAGEYTGLIADHLSLAGRSEEAVGYLRRAAEQAAAQYANEEAARYYSRALELTPLEDAAERYRLLLAREALYDLLGRPEERGHDLAALETLAAALDDGCPVEDRVHQADIALRRAEYERLIGNFGASIKAARAAVRLAQEAGDRVREAKGRRAWGWSLTWEREYDGARRQYEQALALARESGARQVEAECLTGLGWVFWNSGASDPTMISTSDEEGVSLSHQQALHLCHEQALQLYRETGDRRGEASALNALGVLCVGQGELARARTYYEETLAISREIGNRIGEAGPTGNLAWVFRGEDDYAGAIECSERELAIRREVGDRPYEAGALIDIGQTLGAQGHYAQGEAHIWQAVRIDGGQDPGGAELSDLGLIRYYQGDYAQARAFLEKALPLRTSAAPFEQSKDRAVLSLVCHAQGDDEAALDFAQQSLERGQDRYHLGRGDSALVRGHALAGLGDAEGATAAYQQALQRYRQSGFVNPPMEALAGLARLSLAGGAPAQALDHVEEILAHLQAHTLNGTYEPFRIYLTCVQVLLAHDDPRAAEVLGNAYRLLQERAAEIEDERLRRSFLENVRTNREILSACAERGIGYF